jgi:hypothetical protein
VDCWAGFRFPVDAARDKPKSDLARNQQIEAIVTRLGLSADRRKRLTFAAKRMLLRE